MEKVVFEGVRHFCGCALKVEYFSKIPFPRPRLRFLAHLKSISQRPFSMTMFLSTDECQLKYFFLLFSTISHEPSKTQDCTICMANEASKPYQYESILSLLLKIIRNSSD